ncbi:MAG: hypothetical protein WCI66_08785 [Gammaproteobacteria bacterium]
MTAPIYYLPHGGGPMPLLDDPAHAGLIRFLKALNGKIAKPEAIVLISAHWEEAQPSVYAGDHHGMLFDYYGFPAPTYAAIQHRELRYWRAVSGICCRPPSCRVRWNPPAALITVLLCR